MSVWINQAKRKAKKLLNEIEFFRVFFSFRSSSVVIFYFPLITLLSSVLKRWRISWNRLRLFQFCQLVCRAGLFFCVSVELRTWKERDMSSQHSFLPNHSDLMTCIMPGNYVPTHSPSTIYRSSRFEIHSFSELIFSPIALTASHVDSLHFLSLTHFLATSNSIISRSKSKWKHASTKYLFIQQHTALTSAHLPSLFFSRPKIAMMDVCTAGGCGVKRNFF